MTAPITITVLGAGYVGLTTAALLSNAGYEVFVVEPNEERLSVIKSGRSFFYEQGLDAVIQNGLQSGTLIATSSYDESVPKSSIVFSCVGTPDNPDGSSNLSYVFAAAERTAQLALPGTIYVQKSTVPVRTGERLSQLFEQNNAKLSYVSNPEFLREGTALYDTLFFDRVVAGGNDTRSVEVVLDVYRQLEDHRKVISTLAGIQTEPRKGRYVATSLNSAELIKVTANAFLALKISFANSIAKLADKVDADVNEVMDAVGADERIGRPFLNAGRGYGGGCFPKDVSGLIASGLENGVDLEIMQAAQSLNNSMPNYVVEKLKNSTGSLKDMNVAVLGLAFKAGTSDVRKSPGIAIANILTQHGSHVTAYDPQANREAEHSLLRSVNLKESLEAAIVNADAIILATDWPEFRNIMSSKLPSDCTLIDAVNMLDRSSVEISGNTYIGIGR